MPPTIIFLMTDQHRYDALGCVTPIVQTPTLDALAADGVRYSEAVCNIPMCVPSRYSLMLGYYASQTGLRHNTNICPSDAELPGPVLAHYLADAGYQCAGFGKTHWYEQQAGVEQQPSTRGFEVRAIARGSDSQEREPGACMLGDALPDAWATYQAEVGPWGVGQESVDGYLGRHSSLPPSQLREGWLTEEAINFLDTERDAERPLFLYLSFDSPHAGMNLPPGYEERYELADIPERFVADGLDGGGEHIGPDHRADAWRGLTSEERRRTTLRYYALCSYVDDCFGQLLEKLRAMGELDNALIVFPSDHGEMLGDRRHIFSKYCLYDPSVRVPILLSGSALPEGLRGSVDARPAELVDVLPTLLQVAGVEAPAELAGRSLLQPPCRQGQFAEMHGKGYEQHQQGPAYMWRTQRWKLILSLPGLAAEGPLRLDEACGELYDLQADPHEVHNLYEAPEQLATRESLTRSLLLHLAATWARFPSKPGKPDLSTS